MLVNAGVSSKPKATETVSCPWMEAASCPWRGASHNRIDFAMTLLAEMAAEAISALYRHDRH